MANKMLYILRACQPSKAGEVQIHSMRTREGMYNTKLDMLSSCHVGVRCKKNKKDKNKNKTIRRGRPAASVCIQFSFSLWLGFA